MVNAWSLAASVLNGTFDEDYPIMDKTKGRWDEDITITSRESDEYDVIHPNNMVADTSPLIEDGLDYEVNYYDDYQIMDKTKGRWSDDITITSRESDEYDIINPNEDDGLDYEINYYDDYLSLIHI